MYLLLYQTRTQGLSGFTMINIFGSEIVVSFTSMTGNVQIMV